jgi:hypothetical protein
MRATLSTGAGRSGRWCAIMQHIRAKRDAAAKLAPEIRRTMNNE